MTISTPVATQEVISEEAVATEEVAKVKRPKVLGWVIAFVVTVVVTTLLMPYIHSTENVYVGVMLNQFLNLVGFTLFIITVVQFWRWVLSFVDIKGFVKTVMKAYAKKK